MKKIIYVEDYFDSSAGYQINELIKVTPNNIELILITSVDMSPFYKIYDESEKEKDRLFSEKYGVKIIRLDVRLKIGTRIILKNLKRTIKKINPYAVFLHGFGDFKDIQFLIAPKLKYKIYRDCHMSWVASKNKYAKYLYKTYALSLALIINYTNKYSKIYALGCEEKEYIKALGINEKKISVLPHGYNDTVFYLDENLRKITRKNLGIERDEILISYIGKFDSKKEPHINLEIFNSLGEKFIKEHKIKILFLGPKEKEYMDNVFNKRLEKASYIDNIIMLPRKKVEELNQYYNASDICMWPKETTLSSIHAQIAGSKIIMENHKSNQERVIENEFLFEIGNLEDAKNKLSNLIKKLEDKKYKLNLKLFESREYKNIIKKLIYDIQN